MLVSLATESSTHSMKRRCGLTNSFSVRLAAPTGTKSLKFWSTSMYTLLEERCVQDQKFRPQNTKQCQTSRSIHKAWSNLKLVLVHNLWDFQRSTSLCLVCLYKLPLCSNRNRKILVRLAYMRNWTITDCFLCSSPQSKKSAGIKLRLTLHQNNLRSFYLPKWTTHSRDEILI